MYYFRFVFFFPAVFCENRTCILFYALLGPSTLPEGENRIWKWVWYIYWVVQSNTEVLGIFMQCFHEFLSVMKKKISNLLCILQIVNQIQEVIFAWSRVAISSRSCKTAIARLRKAAINFNLAKYRIWIDSLPTMCG